MNLVDTHCHIQSIGNRNPNDFTAQKWQKAGIDKVDNVIKSARDTGVTRLVCVGTSVEDSIEAVKLANVQPDVWASVGVHPHNAKDFFASKPSLESLIQKVQRPSKVVAIGEIGLDYHYEHSPKTEQKQMFEQFLDLAKKYDLPVIFHVREAFDDFWPILGNFEGVRGVLHSFSDNGRNLDKALKSGLYIGLNGIMTFTKDKEQLESAKNVPLDRLLLETDAPYLAPKPHRGKVCKPEHVRDVAEFLAELRGESIEELAAQTTKNAQTLFGIE